MNMLKALIKSKMINCISDFLRAHHSIMQMINNLDLMQETMGLSKRLKKLEHVILQSVCMPVCVCILLML